MLQKKLKKRCGWAGDDPLYISYHDKEWGVPVFEDQKLFEFLILEGMQAGLSWITILKKRENYRQALDNFDAEKIARYKQATINKLLNNPGIIRNRLKVESIISNAQAYLQVQEEFPSFAEYIWHFVDREPIQNHWKNYKDVPPTSLISDQMSKELKKRGFKFIGSTICYAFMQAVGLVNDHCVDCFRYQEIKNSTVKKVKIATKRQSNRK